MVEFETATHTSRTYSRLRHANEARQRLWDPHGSIGPLFRATELAGELGEALNIVKKLERERMGLPGSRATVDQLAEELADIVIVVDLLAAHYGIQLGAAVVDKFNATSMKMGFPTYLQLTRGL